MKTIDDKAKEQMTNTEFNHKLYAIPNLVLTEQAAIDVLTLCKEYASHLFQHREGWTDEDMRTIIDFASRVAKVMKEQRSSTIIFIMQQAYPDDIEGLDQPNVDEILDNVITISSLPPKTNREGELAVDLVKYIRNIYWQKYTRQELTDNEITELLSSDEFAEWLKNRK